MFQFARTSTKAVLVAAGAAGFVAFGAGIASADALSPLGVTDALPVGPVTELIENPRVPDLATTVPAPRTANVSGPLGDMSGVGPEVHDYLTVADSTVDLVERSVGLSTGVEHQSAPADLAGTATGLLESAPLPLPKPSQLPVAAGATTGAATVATRAVGEGVTGTLLPRTTAATEDAVDTLPRAVAEGIDAHEPRSPLSISGLENAELPLVGADPATAGLREGVDGVTSGLASDQGPSLDDLNQVGPQDVVDGVTGAVDNSVGVRGVTDAIGGVGLPV
jgi:hypothetical protein